MQNQGSLIKQWRLFVYDRHDIHCNQKYDETLPYSFHLKVAEKQLNLFINLFENKIIEDNSSIHGGEPVELYTVLIMSVIGHDLIEDARMTYNDVFNKVVSILKNGTASKLVTDIIYKVTDEKGKNREERKNDKFFDEINELEFAVLIKLVDICANKLYGKMMCSSMYIAYNREHNHLEEKLYKERFKPIFEYLKQI